MSQDGRARTMGGGAPHSSSEDACAGFESPTNPITLAVPRPEHQRATNLYVDVPFQHKVFPLRDTPSHFSPGTRTQQNLPLVHGGPHRLSLHRHHAKSAVGPISSPGAVATLQKSKRTHLPVDSQPSSISFTKERVDQDSIICRRCGRCRCEACSQPRSSSGAWLCGGKCHVSSTEAVECLSCLCCVKGVLYHCGSDAHEDSSLGDSPCVCSGSDTCLRWTCLALASFPLPCLICYWPLRGFKALFEKTYERFSSQGCRCNPSPKVPHRTNTLPHTLSEKRLLHDCA